MTDPIDLAPACDRMIDLVAAVDDSALTRRTPCEGYTVGALLDHVDGAARAFTAAAHKRPLPRAASADAAALGPDWRSRIPTELRALAEAWRDPAAWGGMTAAGGVDLPGDLAGVVALDELVVHGWDLARALDLPAGYDGPGLEAVHETVQHFRAAGIEGLFGPLVPVPADAPLLDRILGVAGRDPGWRPPP
jgi:uncharacterized protein (TIGR03086 family)